MEIAKRVEFGRDGGWRRGIGGTMTMRRLERVAILVAGVGTLCALAAHGRPGVDDKVGVTAFNEKFRAAHERMDTPGILAMWSETGVSLLPETAPVVGKAAVTKFMTNAVANLAGHKELKVEMDFRNVRVCGDWATEWAIEHQVIQPPDGSR
jgi:ketosteroid isomerase-like protein